MLVRSRSTATGTFVGVNMDEATRTHVKWRTAGRVALCAVAAAGVALVGLASAAVASPVQNLVRGVDWYSVSEFVDWYDVSATDWYDVAEFVDWYDVSEVIDRYGE
jgi:hypothetical protein